MAIKAHPPQKGHSTSGLATEADRQRVLELLDPLTAYARAAAIEPQAATYRKWLLWAKDAEVPSKQIEDIAVQWNRALPRESEPLF